MDIPKPPPIACTLSAMDFKDRAQWLNELSSEALVQYEIDGLQARLVYRADAAEDVRKLVEREQQCCGFLQFDLRAENRQGVLMITAPASAGADAKALFAHLIPTAR